MDTFVGGPDHLQGAIPFRTLASLTAYRGVLVF